MSRTEIIQKAIFKLKQLREKILKSQNDLDKLVTISINVVCNLKK